VGHVPWLCAHCLEAPQGADSRWVCQAWCSCPCPSLYPERSQSGVGPVTGAHNSTAFAWPSWLIKREARWRCLLVFLMLGSASCRRSNRGDSQRPDAEVVTQPPSACSIDGWCRASPYLPEIRTAGSSPETWQLIDRTQLFRRKTGESWRRIPFPAGFGIDIASAGEGRAWVLSPRCQSVSSVRRRVFGTRKECAETTIYAYDGHGWASYFLPNHVYSIWAANSSDVWAVGGNDHDENAAVQVHRWDGTSWRLMPPRSGTPGREVSNVTGPLRRVTGTSPSDVW